MSRDRLRGDRFDTLTTPATGQVSAATAMLTLSVVVATPLLVQTAVAYATTGQPAWPHDWVGTAIPGLLHGKFGAGLTPSAAGRLPSDALLWALTGVTETVLLVFGILALRRVWARVAGRDRSHGIATPAEAERSLGSTALRHHATIIRPDLYPPRRRRPPLLSRHSEAKGYRAWSPRSAGRP